MAMYRCLISKIILGDQVFSRKTGTFELSDKVALPLLEDKRIAPVNAPVTSGIAEETMHRQA